MMESKFFSNTFVSDYQKMLNDRFIKDIENMSDSKFAQYDDATLVEYFYNKLDLNPLIINDKENPQIKLRKKIDNEDTYNSWYGFGIPNQPMYRTVKVENLYWEYSVRLTGNIEFAFLRPSTYTGSFGEDDYENLEIKESKDNGYHILTVTIKKSVDEAEKIPDIKDAIYKIFIGSLGLFEKNLKTVNSEVSRMCSNIKDYIKRVIEERRHNLSVSSNIFEKFNIPLDSNQTIKFAEPLVIHKRNVSLPEVSDKKIDSYYIKKEDLKNINELIYNFCSTMERTPKTYSQSGEEDIRNTILAALNTQYSNATGETFSNAGKTDIFIGKYNSAAYIAECKIWKGKQVFLDTINQLLSYTTYKECQGTILLFNKKNLDFKSILTEIPEIIKTLDNLVSINSIKGNCIDFTIAKKDKSNFDIKVMMFNFYSKDKPD